MYAAQGGQLGAAKLLLEVGADPNALDKSSTTPLVASVKNGHIEVVRLLLNNGAHANTENPDLNPLFDAIALMKLELVRILLEGGANPNVIDSQGKTPLMIAVFGTRNLLRVKERIRILLDAGADVNARDKEGMTVLDHALAPEIIALLEEAGAKE